MNVVQLPSIDPTAHRAERDAGPFAGLWASYIRSVRAAGRSEQTVDSYTYSAKRYEAFAFARGWSTEPSQVTREQVREFMQHLVSTLSAATAANRFRALSTFFKWCVIEEELEKSPMAGMQQPTVVAPPVPVIDEADLSRLLASVAKDKTFVGKRDHAILRLLINSGARLGEVANLRVEDVGLCQGSVLPDDVIQVLGKGSKVRFVTLGANTLHALDRYIRARRLHPRARLPFFWLGRQGRMTDSGVVQVVMARAEQAGLGHVHVHQFRHTQAHLAKQAGVPDGDIMRQMGWSNPSMLNRYGASNADARARESYRRLSPGDNL